MWHGNMTHKSNRFEFNKLTPTSKRVLTRLQSENLCEFQDDRCLALLSMTADEFNEWIAERVARLFGGEKT